MKRKCLLLATIAGLCSSHVYAATDIEVLVARTGSVLNAEALAIIDELNDLMENSDISARNFRNANTNVTHVEQVSCGGTNVNSLLT